MGIVRYLPPRSSVFVMLHAIFAKPLYDYKEFGELSQYYIIMQMSALHYTRTKNLGKSIYRNEVLNRITL
jgi:hypothetical protein